MKKNKNSKRSRLAKEAVAAAFELHRRRLWQVIDVDECVALRVPDESHLLIASIMGQAGEEVGLALYRGPGATQNMLKALRHENLDDDALDRLSTMSMSIAPLWQVPMESRPLLQEAGMHPLRDAMVPCFLVKRPHRKARLPNQAELRAFLYALRGILKAHDEGVLCPQSILDNGSILTLTVSGDTADPEYAVEQEALESRAQADTPPLPRATLAEGLPRLDGTWLVGLPVMPVSIKNDDRTVRAVVVLDQKSGRLLKVEIIMGDELQRAAKVALSSFHGENVDRVSGLPKKVIFTSRELFDRLAPLLASAEVRCLHEADAPAMQRVTRSLGASLASGADFVPAQELHDPQDLGIQAASDDLEESELEAEGDAG